MGRGVIGVVLSLVAVLGACQQGEQTPVIEKDAILFRESGIRVPLETEGRLFTENGQRWIIRETAEAVSEWQRVFVFRERREDPEMTVVVVRAYDYRGQLLGESPRIAGYVRHCLLLPFRRVVVAAADPIYDFTTGYLFDENGVVIHTFEHQPYSMQLRSSEDGRMFWLVAYGFDPEAKNPIPYIPGVPFNIVQVFDFDANMIREIETKETVLILDHDGHRYELALPEPQIPF